MARAPVADRLRHILDSVAKIETLTAGKSFEDYAADWVTRDAVERNRERASEASRHLPPELKARHKEIAWRAVAGLSKCCATTVLRCRTSPSGTAGLRARV